ncbi:fibronectin type III domain protein [Ancylostoma duodenale]|uniref:Fibronectin type III domain protein n=1 Tax=Ancylostoma duodenale TaxID=51022 RepID=A0A0C2H1L3_9BILA|nr:fibronectin type III domain protein [Ancylostoma duodenale]
MAGVDSCIFKISVENSGGEHEKHRRRKHTLRPITHQKNEFSSDSELENKTKRKRRRMRRVTERTNPNAPRLTQMIAPRFDKALDDHDVETGEQIVMMVATQGNPPPNVHFYRDGKALSNDEKYEIRHEGETVCQQHYLIVKNTEHSEEAEYACQAVNPAGEAWCYSDVLVRTNAENTNETENAPLDEISLSPSTTKKTDDAKNDEVEHVKKEKEETQNSVLHTKIIKANKKDKENEYKLRKTEEAEGEVRVKNVSHGELGEIIKSQSNDTPTKGESHPAPIQEDGKASQESISKENKSRKLSSQLQAVAKKQIKEENGKAGQQDIEERKRDAMVDESTVGEPSLLNNEEEESSISDVVSTNTSANEPPPRPPKKKKNVPKALVIPYEINSLFGDPSTLRSEANITAKITAPEGTAEAISPVKEPRSASISAKVESVCRSFSRSGTPREVSAEFVFKQASQSHAQEICFQQKMLNKSEDVQNTIKGNSARARDDEAKQPGTNIGVDEQSHTLNGKEKNLKQVTQPEMESSVETGSDQNKAETIFEQEHAADGASVKSGQKTNKVSKNNDVKGEKTLTMEAVEEGPSGVSSGENISNIIPREDQASDASTKLAQNSNKALRQKEKKVSRVKQRTNPGICADKDKENERSSESKGLETYENALDRNAVENDLISENQAKQADSPEGSEATSKRHAKEMRDPGDQNEARSDVLSKKKDGKKNEAEKHAKKKEAQKEIQIEDKNELRDTSAGKEVLRPESEGAPDIMLSLGNHSAEQNANRASRKTVNDSEERCSIIGEDEDQEEVVGQARKDIHSAEDAKTSAADRKINEERTRDNKSRKEEKTQEYKTDDMSIEDANNIASTTTEEDTLNEQEVKRRSAAREKAGEEPNVEARTEGNLEKRFGEQRSEKQEKPSKTRGEDEKEETVLDRYIPAVPREGDKDDDCSAFHYNKDQVAAERNKTTFDSTQLSSGESNYEKEKSVELGSKQVTTEEHKSVETEKKSNKTGLSSEADSSSQPSSEPPDGKKPVKTRHRKKKAEFAATPDTEMIARAGDTLRLQCVVLDEHDKVEWFINGKPIHSNSRCSEEIANTTRTLLIRDLTSEDRGMIVEMRIGETVATSQLIIEENPAVIVKQLAKEFICEKGEPVTLEIEMNHEVREMMWFKNGEPVFGRKGCSLESSGTVCKLKINAADYGDSGNYVVVADGFQSSTQLLVSEAPRFKEEVQTTVDVKKTDDIMLSIPFDCSTKPFLKCLKNGSPIEKNVKYQLETRGNEVYFCKRKGSKADSGVYSFTIWNQFGEDTKVINVSVKDVPEPPSRLTLTKLGSDTVSINWESPRCDDAEDITGYVIEKREGVRRTFHEVAKDTGSPYTPPSIDEPPTVSDVTANGCVVTWTRPVQDGGSPIYGYDVFCREGNGKWTKLNEEIVFGERYVVRNLQHDINYEFKVEAYNEADMRSTSEVISKPLLIPSSLNLPLTIPSVPRITVTGPDSVTLDWDSPEDEPSTKFTVAYKSEGSDVWTEVHCDSNFCKVDGLKEEVSYVFKVAVKNEYGIGNFSENSTPIKILPGSPPAVLKPIRDVSVPRKRTLRLECHASGHPTPHHLWYRNDVEIIPQDANTEIINEGSISVLIIHSVDVTDGGLYVCEIENEHGTAKTTAHVTIGDVRCHFDSSFPEQNETEIGRDVELCCTLSDETGVVLWYKDGRKLEENSRITFVIEGNKRILRINSVESADSGTYRCETSDRRNSTEGELIVREEESHISVGPQDQIIRHCGDSVKLTCELTKPTSCIRWFKDGMEVWQQTGKYIIVTDGCCSTLQILNFDKIDIGDYCAAVDNDEISAPARLNLEVSPTIRIREQIENSVLVNAHAELDFHIEVAGHPAPTMTILHNGARIQARALMEKYEDVIRIRMKNLTQADSGVVTITAENTNGVDQKVFNIVVVDVPSAPTDLCATNVTTSSASLSWNCPKETNGSPITGFIIQRKTVDSVRWRTVGKTDATTLAFEAGDLFSGEEYLFRVVAVNIVGEGPPSSQVEVLTVNDNENSEGFSEALSSEVVTLDTPKTPTIKQDGDKLSRYGDERKFYVKSEQRHDSNECKGDGNPKSSQSSKGSGDVMNAAGKGENKEQENVNEVGIHGGDEASAKTIKKEKHREKLEDQREEQEKKESTPKTTKKKQPSPVDDILDTKQRLKKRVRDGQERRPSLQQECSNVPERKHSLPGMMKNDLETTPSPLETKLKERQEGAASENASATKSAVGSDSTIDADITATTSSSQAANAQGTVL